MPQQGAVIGATPVRRAPKPRLQLAAEPVRGIDSSVLVAARVRCMTAREPLAEVAEHLPQLDLTLREMSWDASVQLATVIPERYVWPDLEIEEAPQRGAVLLVTAPGAMGKSSAARAIASISRAPLIDLAKLPIGSDSLTGLLTRVLGWGQAPGFVERLRSGRASLVLDSLDEAQLAAGRTHFLAFMRNVAELVAGAEGRHQVVIFGRRDTMETAFLALTEMGVDSQFAIVAPLTHQQSARLIDLTLDDHVLPSGAHYATHRTHAKPFGTYRDQVLLSMAKALGTSAENVEAAWQDSGNFLGYPPVLSVLAQHLAVDNPGASLGAALAPLSQGSWRGQLLRQILEGIMDRESLKVRTQLSSALGLAVTDPHMDVVYTREEQVLRLLSHLSRTTLVVPLPASLTDSQRAVYEDQIGIFVPDHPFLRGTGFENVVFEDYVHAFLMTSPLEGVQGRTAVKEWTFRLGPFFAHFVHAMAGQKDVGLHDTVAQVSEDIIDELIKSFDAGAQTPSPFVITQRQGVLVLVLLDRADADKPRQTTLLFSVNDGSGVLELSSPITRGVVISDGGLVVTSSTDEIEFGPEVFISVEDLELQGKRISVSAGLDAATGEFAGSTMIIVVNEPQHEPDLKVSAHPPECLAVSWSNPWHQWRPFLKSSALPADRIDRSLSWQVMFGLRRLLMVFQGSAADEPSLYYERLERFAVGANEVFAAVLQSLQDIGVIVRRGTLYRLQLDRLADFGVSYAALRGSRFEETLTALHAEVCRTDAVRRLAEPGPPRQ